MLRILVQDGRPWPRNGNFPGALTDGHPGPARWRPDDRRRTALRQAKPRSIQVTSSDTKQAVTA